MNKLVLFVALAAIAIAAGCVGQGPSPTGELTNPHLSSVSAVEAAPMSLITLEGSGFGPTAMVAFSDGNYTVFIPPVAVTTNSIKVGVPPYIDAQGNYISGLVSVSVIQTVGDSMYQSNAVEGFTINALPTTSLAHGRLTLDFIQGSIDRANELRTEIVGTDLDTAEMRASLANYISVMTTLTGKIQAVINDPSSNFALGNIGGRTVTVDSKALGDTDRMILAMFEAQATGELEGIPLTATGQASSAGVAFAADISADCLQQQASGVVGGVPQGVIGGAEYGQPGYTMVGYYKGPTTSPLCKAAEAFNTGFGVVSAAAAVGTGLAGTAVLATGASAGLAMSLPSAVLTYIATAGGSAMIAIGGQLGKDTPGAAALVKTGYQTIQDAVVSTAKAIFISTALPEAAGPISDLYDGVKGMHDAYAGESQRAQTPGTDSLFALTLSWSGTGTGTLFNDPGGINGLDCGASRTCTIFFKPGTTVTVTNEPDESSKFIGYSGACTGTTCTIIMNSDKSLAAQFDLDVVHLNAFWAGDGGGSFNTEPGSMTGYADECGVDTACAGTFARGSTVVLTAEPMDGSVFDGFSGDCSGKSACTLAMNADKRVTITFSLETTTPVTPVIPVVPTPEPEPEPEPTPSESTVAISSVSCRQLDKVVRGQITDYIFEITATGTATGPVDTRVVVQSFVDRTGSVLSTCTTNPFSGAMLSGGISGTSWTVGPSPYEPCPNDQARRASGEPEQTSFTVSWPHIIEDAYGYLDDDVIAVVASTQDDSARTTVTCVRG